MSDDEQNDPPASVTSLQEFGERADERALEALDADRRDQSQTLFRVHLADILQRCRAPAFGSDNYAAGTLSVTLRDIDRARLPVIYRNAVQALRECVRIDECADWANKAEALASYARQAKTDELRAMADRIQARAIRRCGELIAEIKAARGRRTDLELRDGGGPMSPTRTQAAETAGLSERQRKTAIRVSSVPAEEFERAVEAERPATVTALAARGIARRLSAKAEFVEHKEIWLQVPVTYSRCENRTIDEIGEEQQVAVLMAAWRGAGNAARRRFLQNIGYPINYDKPPATA